MHSSGLYLIAYNIKIGITDVNLTVLTISFALASIIPYIIGRSIAKDKVDSIVEKKFEERFKKLTRNYIGFNDWYSSGNFYIDSDEINACFEKYEDQSKQLFIYNPETQEIESYEFGPDKIGVNLDYGYVEPELRFWLNSETYKIKKYMNEVE